MLSMISASQNSLRSIRYTSMLLFQQTCIFVFIFTELIYMGECLVDEERSLTSYGIQHNFTVFVIEKEKELDDEHCT